MLLISIDGACRRNGKPNCVSAGGIFTYETDSGSNTIKSDYDLHSTNQRGELLALLTALDYMLTTHSSASIITDSEYIFNAMTKEWFVGWQSRQWLTASYEPVKNSDLWRKIYDRYEQCRLLDLEAIMYHIKGHCIPFGKVTASTLLTKDPTGKTLYEEALKKYDTVSKTSRADALIKANELSVKNNGYELQPDTLRMFVAMNTVADAVATQCVEAADKMI